MIIKRIFNPVKVLSYVWREFLYILLFSILVYVVYHSLGLKYVALPSAPVVMLGTALSIFLAFRNNSSYGRWWEARTIWGGIVSNSRIFSRMIVTMLDSAAEKQTTKRDELHNLKKAIVYRHIAWVNALRLHLRGQKNWNELSPFLSPSDYEMILKCQNKPNMLIQIQGRSIKEAINKEILGPFDNFHLENNLTQFVTQQGACERIKTTPLLRQYDFFTRLFVWIFITLLPLSLIGLFPEQDVALLVIPVSMIIGLVFALVNKVGEVNEDPFENRIQDVPMTALCRTIERDLKEQLGETDLPPDLQPEKGYLY